MKLKTTLLLVLFIYTSTLSSQVLVETIHGTSSNQIKMESLINTDQYVMQSEVKDQKIFVKNNPSPAAGRVEDIELEIYVEYDPEVYFLHSLAIFNESGYLYSPYDVSVNPIIVNVPEGQYDFICYFFKHDEGINGYLIKEQIDVQANVPVTLTLSEAQNFIQMSFLDDEGETLRPEPFGSGPRAKSAFSQHFIFNPADMVVWNTFSFWVALGGSGDEREDSWNFYINDISDRYSFIHFYNAVRHDGLFFASQFESIDGFNNDSSYQNDPEDYIFHQDKFQPSVAGTTAGNYLKGIKTMASWNERMIGGFGIVDDDNEIDLEEGISIYLDNHFDEGLSRVQVAPSLADYYEAGLPVMIAGNPILLGNPGDIEYGSGATAMTTGNNLHIIDGYSRVLPFNPQFTFSKDESTEMIQGNNVPILNVVTSNYILADTKRTDINVQSIGRYGEVRESDHKEISVLLEYNGDSIYNGDIAGLPRFLLQWRVAGHPDGVFDITATSTNTQVDGIPGFSRTKVSSDWTKEDWTAPSISRLQFRDISGQVVDRFDSAEDGTVRIASGDFEFDYISGSFAYQEGSQLEFLYRKNGEEDWEEIELTEYPEYFFMPGFGAYYEASLEDVIVLQENSWFDVKVISTDAMGNSQEQIISPAFKISNATIGIDDLNMEELIVYPNPVENILTLNANDQIEKVEIYNLLGKKLFSSSFNKKEVQIDVSQFSAGIYLVNINTSQSTKTYKIIKE